MDVDKLAFKPTEVAEAIGCSRTKAYEMIASGELPSVMIGGLRRVPVTVLKALMDQRLAEQAADSQQDTRPIQQLTKQAADSQHDTQPVRTATRPRPKQRKPK